MHGMNLKQDIIRSVLTDDLKRARALLGENPNEFPLIAELLDRVREKPLPLNHFQSDKAEFVVLFPSYTCGVGCKMCCTGFSDKTRIYENYPYMSPEQYDSHMPWVEKASYVIYCGLGETLESPHIMYFLEKVRDKISIIYTSGVPVTREKIRDLIRAELKILTFSFDGKTPLGHGSGSESYIQKFWEKIDRVTQVKKEMNSIFPKVTLNITINQDNQNELNEIIETAKQHGILEIMIDPMTSFDNRNFGKTIFADFENSKNKINLVLDRWNSDGVDVTQTGFTGSFEDSSSCPYIDNWLTLIGTGPSTVKAGVCEGVLDIPKSVQGFNGKQSWNSFPIRYLRHLHFDSSEKSRPMHCQNCILTNLKNYADLSLARNSDEGNEEDAALLEYRRASTLKSAKKWTDARQGFLKALENHHDFILKGKAYFHLGEMELSKKDDSQARKYFEMAVQNYYDHDLAFAYLYLLVMLDPPVHGKNIRKKFDAAGMVRAKYDQYIRQSTSKAHDPASVTVIPVPQM
ncbi:hypothetical protein UZ36_01415 [Candidatus Nitromaritima sp. SCGC AAA799-C22]|nr:hypothetical protein UZ36_01415 [Candidatus Nitromaritima sp. SCGC AAA799-C22]